MALVLWIAIREYLRSHVIQELGNVLLFIGDAKLLSILLRPRCRSRFRGRRFLIFPFATTRRLAPSCMSDFSTLSMIPHTAHQRDIYFATMSNACYCRLFSNPLLRIQKLSSRNSIPSLRAIRSIFRSTKTSTTISSRHTTPKSLITPPIIPQTNQTT